MAINCSLYRDKIPEAINDFVMSQESVTFDLKTKTDDKDVYVLHIGRGKCHINVFYKHNGLTSISCQTSQKYELLGQQCIDYIISKASLPDSLHKSFTIDHCNDENYEYFKEAVSETLTVEDITTSDVNVSNRFQAKDNTGADVTITLYQNNTFLVQGRVTPLFITVIGLALDWLPTRKEQTLMSCLGMSNMVVTFDEDPCNHINNHSVLPPDCAVLLKSVQTSLQLANSGIIVSDYSCYTFNILRAMEGLIKQCLLKDVPPFNDFGTYFYKDRRTNTYRFHNDCALYDGVPKLKRALEHAYTYYNKNRHSTFHVDDQIETTRILSYQEAITIIQEGLVHFNAICDNWN